MWKSSAALVLAVQFVAGVAAHGHGGWDWVHGLPKCWERCIGSANDGCSSKSCICENSQDEGQLMDAVTCLKLSCREQGAQIRLGFLVPLQMYCAATGDGISDSVMSKAYDCATATTTSATPSSTHKADHSKNEDRKTTKAALESTVTSTVTLTTTDAKGSTIEVLIPIMMGPSTISTGKIVTSTPEDKSTEKSTATPAATSNFEPIFAAPTETPTEAATSAPAPRETNIGQGSPFEIGGQGGGAANLGFSGALAGAGVLLGALARL